VLQILVRGVFPHESRLVVCAPPVKLVAPVAPVATFPFPNESDDVAVFVGGLLQSNRHLPTHVGLPIHWSFARVFGRDVKGATDPSREARPVQKDACSVDDTGLDGSVSFGRPPSCFLGPVLELPMPRRESTCRPTHRVLIRLVDEMRPETAATLHQFGCVLLVDSFASLAVDAFPVAEEIRGVEDPHPTAVGVFETHPIMDIIGTRHGATLLPKVFCNQTSMSSLSRMKVRRGRNSGAAVVDRSPLTLELVSRDASNIRGAADAFVLANCIDDVVRVVSDCHRRAVPFVPRGAGTGLAAGAVPDRGGVVISMMGMNRIREINPVERWAWVEPGVLNADLSRATKPHGLHFAPDPSSQQSCSIGGNVANNSGGPHCLSMGVTSAHVLAVEVVLPDGKVCVLDSSSVPFDLRGAFVGSEGMFGVATAVKVRLTQNAPAVATLVVGFGSIGDGARAVSSIISAGIVPSALEMMDAPITRAVEAYVGAGFPLDAEALLIVEIEGLANGVEQQIDQCLRIAREHGATSSRRAGSDAERALIWKGRKTAFGAIARIQPNYYLHDTVVPRRKLADVLARVAEIAADENLQVMNVFHAGDGNLHPLLLFDKRVPGVMDRVHRAGEGIVRASIDAGGVLSGEHGIGLEKREFMPLMFDENSLEAQARLRAAFDPTGIANPGKVLPSPSTCGDPGRG
jgi:glycolate oxidase